jgi:tetratricopeptide (TPR) repeat protein
MKKSKIPVFKSISIISFLPQAAILIVIFEIFRYLNVPKYELLSVLAFIMLSIYLKIIIPRSHRRGILFIKKNNYESALLCFHVSYRFFKRFYWIDKYRALFLLSASKLSYQEMALANMGFCYIRLDKTDEARKMYTRLLKEYPKNHQARQALQELEKRK